MFRIFSLMGMEYDNPHPPTTVVEPRIVKRFGLQTTVAEGSGEICFPSTNFYLRGQVCEGGAS